MPGTNVKDLKDVKDLQSFTSGPSDESLDCSMKKRSLAYSIKSDAKLNLDYLEILRTPSKPI